MFWTRSRVKQLLDQATEAQGRIRDKFAESVIITASDWRVWGQFLDRGNDQHGIYGTSAGMQVLVAAGYPADHQIIAGAMGFLSDVLENNSNPYHLKGDTTLLYKVAYLAEAANPNEATINSECRPMSVIIERALPQQGWGEYFNSDTEKDVHSRVVATAIALLALRRYRPFKSDEKCERAVEWLCVRMPQNGQLAIHAVALATLALIEYKAPGVNIPSYDNAVRYCTTRLKNWVKSRKKVQYGTPGIHHYESRFEDRSYNNYLYFLPDCLTALAFLKLNCPKYTRRYVLRVVEYFAGQIVSKGGFISEATKRMSTVDHLWIYRLLNEFKSKQLSMLLPQPFYVFSNFPRSVRLLISLAYLGIGSWAVYMGIVNRNIINQVPAWKLATWAVAGTVSLALFVRTIWETFMRGDAS